MARTLLENANYINSTIKPAIKSAIIAQGVSVSDSDSFLDYATKIAMIGGGGGGAYELWDYIESDGTQYIDIGRNVVQGQTVETVFHPLSNQVSYAWLFGSGDTTHCYGFQFPQQTTLLVYNGSTSSSGQMSVSTADEYVYRLTLTASNSLDLSYYIFGFHYSETPTGTNIGKFRLYSFSVNGDYFLPCKRKSDGAFGLWDVTNQTFLGDSASGNAFTGGSKIMDLR